MKNKPNIILIYTDQQRYDTIGVNGNPLIKTPNLDELACGGVHFKRAYVTTPICVASRVALFTGRYSHTTHTYNNHRLMPHNEIDLATLMRQHGYHTALIGKDHCFGAELRKRAFDTELCAGHGGYDIPRNEIEQAVKDSRKGAMQKPFLHDPIPAEQATTARLFRDAMEFVDAHKSEPFFLWLSIPDPHPPYMVGSPYDTMYDGVKIPPPAWCEGEMDNKPYRQRLVVEWDRYSSDYPGDATDRLRRIYWGMVSIIDKHTGLLMHHLQKAGIDEDTIVIFTTDHADYMGDHRMIRKGPHVYEALTHVPLIVRWGSRLPARSTEAFAANVDLYPTLCELAELPCPPQVQAVSLAGVLAGDDTKGRQMIFLEHGDPGRPMQPGDLSPQDYERLKAHDGHHLSAEISRGRTRAVRSGRWKYVYNFGDIDELYNLDADPNELRNLADDPEMDDVIRRHRDYLLDWEVQTEDIQF